jgi:transcription termination factor Rho
MTVPTKTTSTVDKKEKKLVKPTKAKVEAVAEISSSDTTSKIEENVVAEVVTPVVSTPVSTPVVPVVTHNASASHNPGYVRSSSYYPNNNMNNNNSYRNNSQGSRGSSNSRSNGQYASNNNGYDNYNRDNRDFVPSNGGSNGDYFSGETVPVSGILEVLPDYGVLRQEDPADPNLPKDVYISQSQIKRFSLRMGDMVKGLARPPKEGERYLSLLKVELVDGLEPEEAKKRPIFSKLTPIFPQELLKLETRPEVVSTRLIDLVAPIGKGQRAMIVAPPKAGKTWLLKDIAAGIAQNYPEVVLLVALIGERPEEVTDMKRSVKGEVFASNFDEKAEEQTRIAEITLERAKRLAEKGKDVVILMDSLTRLARAYNMVVPPSGRTLTGGFDPSALYPAKHFFGAARNFEEKGSLTIIATALVAQIVVVHFDLQQ